MYIVIGHILIEINGIAALCVFMYARYDCVKLRAIMLNITSIAKANMVHCSPEISLLIVSGKCIF